MDALLQCQGGQPKPPPKRRRKRRARASVKILAHQARFFGSLSDEHWEFLGSDHVITASRHITAEFCGFVGQRPSSRLKWGTLHSELKLSMSTLSVATCDSF